MRDDTVALRPAPDVSVVVRETPRLARRAAGTARSEDRESGRREVAPPVGSIGYTGSYRESSGDIVDVSVVSVLEARGPD